jgi:iron complex outermembrane receptor protein
MHTIRHWIFATLLVSRAALAQQTQPPAAQPSATAEPQLEEIIVTAEKRNTTLRDTPIAISAISGETLKSEQVYTIADLTALVPTLKFSSSTSAAQITLRGVGNSSEDVGSETPLAVNYDEVYISRPTELLGGMFDISSIQVLYGPQGTLYGRNATAGAIEITTARPTDTWSGYDRLSIGNYNAVNFEAAVGGPLIADKLLFRVAVFRDNHDGYGTNVVTGHQIDNRDAEGVRATVVATPTDSVKFTGIVERYHQDDLSGGEHYLGALTGLGIPGTDPASPIQFPYGGTLASHVRDLANGVDPRFVLDYTALTGITEWSPGGGPFSFKSITGYRDSKSSNINQIGTGSILDLYVVGIEPDNQFSEELQAHYDTERLHITAGAYYFKEHDNAEEDNAVSQNLVDVLFGKPATAPANAFLDGAEIGGEQDTRAYAFFGEATWKVTDKLSLIAGVRYSDEQRMLFSRYLPALSDPIPITFNPGDPFGSIAHVPINTVYPWVTFTATTPKFGLQYELTPNSMAYVTYAKGFRSGGYNIQQPYPDGVYKPEYINDVEGGYKVAALDDKLQANISIFHYNYSNLQVTQTIGNAEIISNAATAKLYGGEADITYKPDNHWDFRFVGSYLHTEYTKYIGVSGLQYLLPSVDFTGRRLDNAPSFTGNLNVAYHLPFRSGRVTLRGEAAYTSKVYFTPDNVDALSQGAYIKGNLFATYAMNNGWSFTAFVRNISNATTWGAQQVNTPFVAQPLTGRLDPPRTFGAELRYDF